MEGHYQHMPPHGAYYQQEPPVQPSSMYEPRLNQIHAISSESLNQYSEFDEHGQAIAPGQPPSKSKRRQVHGPDHVKHRRTRSGCYTCRQRRVKVWKAAAMRSGVFVLTLDLQCDETRPTCERRFLTDPAYCLTHSLTSCAQDVERESESACTRTPTTPDPPREVQRTDPSSQTAALIHPRMSSTPRIKIGYLL